MLQLQDTQGRPSSPLRLLLVAGDHVMHVRTRAAPWPAGVSPGMSLAALVAAGQFDLLDFEISFGKRDADGWTVSRSTLPWLENTEIRMRVGPLDDARLEVDFDGEVRYWKVLEWSPPA